MRPRNAFLVALAGALLLAVASAQLKITGAGGAGAATVTYSPAIGALLPPDSLFASVAGLGTSGAIGTTDSRQLTMAFALWGEHEQNNSSNALGMQQGALFISAPLLGQSGNITATLCNVGCTGAGNVLTVSAVNKTGTYLEVGEPIYNGATLLGMISALGTGTGGAGVYALSSSAIFLSTGTALTAASGACEASAGWSPSACGSWDNSTQWPQLSFNDAGGLNANAIKLNGVPTGHTVFNQWSWNYYIISFDTTTGNYAVNMNGVDQIANGAYVKTLLAANALPSFNDPNGFGLGSAFFANNSSTAEYEGVSDFFLQPGVSVVCTGAGAPAAMAGISVSCAAANTIPPEILARFENAGRPLDYGANCATPLGSQPPLCYRFKHGALNINEGSLGNVLTVQGFPGWIGGNAAAIYDMPYGPGPGVPAGQPTLKAIASAATSSSQTLTPAGATSQTLSTLSPATTWPQGDEQIIVLQLVWSTTPGADPAVTCPGGFTQLGGGGQDYWDATQLMAIAVCYKVNGPSESGTYQFRWTNLDAAAFRSKAYVTLDYTNVGGIDPASTCAVDVNSTASPAKSPASLTLSSANETVISILGIWRASSATYAQPSVGMTRYRTQQASASAALVICDQYGRAGALTQTSWALGGAIRNTTCSIGLHS